MIASAQTNTIRALINFELDSDCLAEISLNRNLNIIGAYIMEVVTFIDPGNGAKLYCIGPFRDKAQASRAAAGLERISAAPDDRPRGAITQRCWAIFELLKAPRAALIAECARQGINAGTAATQYQRWKKAQGR